MGEVTWNAPSYLHTKAWVCATSIVINSLKYSNKKISSKFRMSKFRNTQYLVLIMVHSKVHACVIADVILRQFSFICARLGLYFVEIEKWKVLFFRCLFLAVYILRNCVSCVLNLD